MSRIARRTIFWTLLLLFTAASIWWLLIIPHRPGDVLRAIPGHANAVIMFDDIADEWPEISGHPLVKMIAASLGVDGETWDELRHDAGLRAFIQLVGRRESVIARVPFLDPRFRETTVLASWIGGESQRLRWSHRSLAIPDLQYEGMLGSWPTWTWTPEPGGPAYYFALVEGMLIGTDGDQHAMSSILEAYDGNFPSLAKRTDLATWNERLLRGERNLRGWLRIVNHRREIDYWYGEVDIRHTNQLSGAIVTKAPAVLLGLPATFELDGLAGLWREAPIATAAFNVDPVKRELAGSPHIVASLTRDVVLNSGAESAALGLFGGDYSGRFKAIKVPTLMAGLHRPEGFDLAALLSALLDRWNAEHQLGLVAVANPVGNYMVYRLEGVAGGIYGSLSAGEQMAVVSAGDWLVISSNYGALEKLILGQAGTALPAELPWARRINDIAAQESVGYLGFDMARGADAFKLAISAYSLKLVFEDADGTRNQRKQLNEMKAWLDTLADMQRLHLLASVADGYVKIDLQAGP